MTRRLRRSTSGPTRWARPCDCAWDPTDPGSWDTNREQNGVQAFYLANVYHDHLADSSIGFDAGTAATRG